MTHMALILNINQCAPIKQNKGTGTSEPQIQDKSGINLWLAYLSILHSSSLTYKFLIYQAKNKGVVMVLFYTEFIREENGEASVQTVASKFWLICKN